MPRKPSAQGPGGGRRKRSSPAASTSSASSTSSAQKRAKRQNSSQSPPASALGKFKPPVRESDANLPALGDEIEVYWDGEDTWFRGTIIRVKSRCNVPPAKKARRTTKVGVDSGLGERSSVATAASARNYVVRVRYNDGEEAEEDLLATTYRLVPLSAAASRHPASLGQRMVAAKSDARTALRRLRDHVRKQRDAREAVRQALHADERACGQTIGLHEFLELADIVSHGHGKPRRGGKKNRSNHAPESRVLVLKPIVPPMPLVGSNNTQKPVPPVQRPPTAKSVVGSTLKSVSAAYMEQQRRVLREQAHEAALQAKTEVETMGGMADETSGKQIAATASDVRVVDVGAATAAQDQLPSWLFVGALVHVAPRMWSGMNDEGGVGRVVSLVRAAGAPANVDVSAPEMPRAAAEPQSAPQPPRSLVHGCTIAGNAMTAGWECAVRYTLTGRTDDTIPICFISEWGNDGSDTVGRGGRVGRRGHSASAKSDATTAYAPKVSVPLWRALLVDELRKQLEGAPIAVHAPLKTVMLGQLSIQQDGTSIAGCVHVTFLGRVAECDAEALACMCNKFIAGAESVASASSAPSAQASAADGVLARMVAKHISQEENDSAELRRAEQLLEQGQTFTPDRVSPVFFGYETKQNARYVASMPPQRAASLSAQVRSSDGIRTAGAGKGSGSGNEKSAGNELLEFEFWRRIQERIDAERNERAAAHRAAVQNQNRDTEQARGVNVEQANQRQKARKGKARKAGKDGQMVHKRGRPVVGARIEIFWKDDDAWYPGKVGGYEGNPPNDLALIEYDDGMEEKLDLDNEVWRELNSSGLMSSFVQQDARVEAAETDRLASLAQLVPKNEYEERLRRAALSFALRIAQAAAQPPCPVGSEIDVYWPVDDAWYRAIVLSGNKRAPRGNVDPGVGEQELQWLGNALATHGARPDGCESCPGTSASADAVRAEIRQAAIALLRGGAVTLTTEGVAMEVEGGGGAPIVMDLDEDETVAKLEVRYTADNVQELVDTETELWRFKSQASTNQIPGATTSAHVRAPKTSAHDHEAAWRHVCAVTAMRQQVFRRQWIELERVLEKVAKLDEFCLFLDPPDFSKASTPEDQAQKRVYDRAVRGKPMFLLTMLEKARRGPRPPVSLAQLEHERQHQLEQRKPQQRRQREQSSDESKLARLPRSAYYSRPVAVWGPVVNREASVATADKEVYLRKLLATSEQGAVAPDSAVSSRATLVEPSIVPHAAHCCASTKQSRLLSFFETPSNSIGKNSLLVQRLIIEQGVDWVAFRADLQHMHDNAVRYYNAIARATEAPRIDTTMSKSEREADPCFQVRRMLQRGLELSYSAEARQSKDINELVKQARLDRLLFLNTEPALQNDAPKKPFSVRKFSEELAVNAPALGLSSDDADRVMKRLSLLPEDWQVTSGSKAGKPQSLAKRFSNHWDSTIGLGYGLVTPAADDSQLVLPGDVVTHAEPTPDEALLRHEHEARKKDAREAAKAKQLVTQLSAQENSDSDDMVVEAQPRLKTRAQREAIALEEAERKQKEIAKAAALAADPHEQRRRRELGYTLVVEGEVRAMVNSMVQAVVSHCARTNALQTDSNSRKRRDLDGISVIEGNVWGMDCYGRRAIELALDGALHDEETECRLVLEAWRRRIEKELPYNSSAACPPYSARRAGSALAVTAEAAAEHAQELESLAVPLLTPAFSSLDTTDAAKESGGGANVVSWPKSRITFLPPRSVDCSTGSEALGTESQQNATSDGIHFSCPSRRSKFIDGLLMTSVTCQDGDSAWDLSNALRSINPDAYMEIFSNSDACFGMGTSGTKANKKSENVDAKPTVLPPPAPLPPGVSPTIEERVAARTLLVAVKLVGCDHFRVYPKGCGLICGSKHGIATDDLVTEYVGEVYPPWRWYEKQEAIEAAQQKFNRRPTLPDFYNMVLERPHLRADIGGYDLLYVDASERSNCASRMSHSCDPNCTTSMAMRGGRLCVAVHALRPIAYMEEICIDYNAATDSEIEMRASICLCGKARCRGAFLTYTGADANNQVLISELGPLARLATLAKACFAPPDVSTEVEKRLRRLGIKEAALPKAMSPRWLRTWAAEILLFIEKERKALPAKLLAEDGVGEMSVYAAHAQAKIVFEQRMQRLVQALDLAVHTLVEQGKVQSRSNAKATLKSKAKSKAKSMCRDKQGSHVPAWQADLSYLDEKILSWKHEDDLCKAKVKGKPEQDGSPGTIISQVKSSTGTKNVASVTAPVSTAVATSMTLSHSEAAQQAAAHAQIHSQAQQLNELQNALAAQNPGRTQQSQAQFDNTASTGNLSTNAGALAEEGKKPVSKPLAAAPKGAPIGPEQLVSHVVQLPNATPVALTGQARDWKDFIGVTRTTGGLYQAQISIKSFGSGSKYIGTFSDPELAARAFDRAARILRGPDAELNFPDLAAGEKPVARRVVPQLKSVSDNVTFQDTANAAAESVSAADTVCKMTTSSTLLPPKSSSGANSCAKSTVTPVAVTAVSKAPLQRLSDSEVISHLWTGRNSVAKRLAYTMRAVATGDAQDFVHGAVVFHETEFIAAYGWMRVLSESKRSRWAETTRKINDLVHGNAINVETLEDARQALRVLGLQLRLLADSGVAPGTLNAAEFVLLMLCHTQCFFRIVPGIPFRSSEPIPVKVKDIVGGVQAEAVVQESLLTGRADAPSAPGWLMESEKQQEQEAKKTQKRKRGRVDNGAGTNELASLKRKKKQQQTGSEESANEGTSLPSARGKDSGSLSGSADLNKRHGEDVVFRWAKDHTCTFLHRALIGWHELEASKSWPDLRGTALLPPIEGCFSSQELWKVRTRPKLEPTTAEDYGSKHDMSGASMAAVGAESNSGHPPPTTKSTPKGKGKGKAKQKNAGKPPVKKTKGSAAAKKKADVALARVKVAEAAARAAALAISVAEDRVAKLEKSACAGEEASSWYISKNNETPKQIATRVGCNISALLKLNSVYKGLSGNSKLMAKTRIRVPGHHEQLGLAPVSSVDVMAVALQCVQMAKADAVAANDALTAAQKTAATAAAALAAKEAAVAAAVEVVTESVKAASDVDHVAASVAFTPERREELITYLEAARYRYKPWPAPVQKCFRFEPPAARKNKSARALAGTGNAARRRTEQEGWAAAALAPVGVDILGSPMLDDMLGVAPMNSSSTAPTSDACDLEVEDGLGPNTRAMLKELMEGTHRKRVLGADGQWHVQSTDHTAWVQCENPNCMKWRKVPAFAAEAIKKNPDSAFHCAHNVWDPTRNACHVPEEDWDDADNTVTMDGVELRIEDLKPGDWVDAFCSRKKVWYEAEVLVVDIPDASEATSSTIAAADVQNKNVEVSPVPKKGGKARARKTKKAKAPRPKVPRVRVLFHNCAHKTDPNGDWLSDVARLAPHHLHTVVTSDKATGWRAQLVHHNAASNDGNGEHGTTSTVDITSGFDENGNNVHRGTNSPWYIATEDETPRAIANKLGVNCKQLVQINKDRYPGLTAASRLMARTKLLVPQVDNDTNPLDDNTVGLPGTSNATDSFDLSKLGLGIWGKAASTTDGKQSGSMKPEIQRRREHSTERRISNKKGRALAKIRDFVSVLPIDERLPPTPEALKNEELEFMQEELMAQKREKAAQEKLKREKMAEEMRLERLRRAEEKELLRKQKREEKQKLQKMKMLEKERIRKQKAEEKKMLQKIKMEERAKLKAEKELLKKKRAEEREMVRKNDADAKVKAKQVHAQNALARRQLQQQQECAAQISAAAERQARLARLTPVNIVLTVTDGALGLHLEEHSESVGDKVFNESIVKGTESGGPAEHAGFQPEDLIVAVGSVTCDRMPLDDILAEISQAKKKRAPTLNFVVLREPQQGAQLPQVDAQLHAARASSAPAPFSHESSPIAAVLPTTATAQTRALPVPQVPSGPREQVLQQYELACTPLQALQQSVAQQEPLTLPNAIACTTLPPSSAMHTHASDVRALLAPQPQSQAQSQAQAQAQPQSQPQSQHQSQLTQ